MCFLPKTYRALEHRLETTGWHTLNALTRAVTRRAVEVLAEKLGKSFLDPDIFWAEHNGPGLENFRRKQKVKPEQTIVCFAKEQGGEGFDDPGVNAILFVLSANTELRLMQTVSRATRAGPKPREEKAFIRCLDETTERYDTICKLFDVENKSFAAQMGLPKTVLRIPQLTAKDHSDHRSFQAVEHGREVLSKLKQQTSANFSEGKPGLLPVKLPTDDNLRRHFNRISQQGPLTQRVSFTSGRDAVQVSVTAWNSMQTILPTPPIPLHFEMLFDQMYDAYQSKNPEEKLSVVRSFAADDIPGTISSMRTSIVQFVQNDIRGYLDVVPSGLKEIEAFADLIIMETWRHFEVFAGVEHSCAFSSRTHNLGCAQCGCTTSFAKLDNHEFRPCWCTTVSTIEDRLDAWRMIYLPSRLQAIISADSYQGAAFKEVRARVQQRMQRSSR